MPVETEILEPLRGGARYRCPKCDSEDTQRLATVYGQGTKATNRGVEQTLTATLATPPRPPEASVYSSLAVGAGTISAILAGWLLWNFTSFTANVVAASAFGLAFGAASYILMRQKFIRPALDRYALDVARWDRSFHCSRCGFVFEA